MLELTRLRPDALPPSPAPLYSRLQQALAEQISDGTLLAGEKLPSERELQEGLGYSRATLRHALQALVESGAVRSVPGSGHYVLEYPSNGPSVPPVLSEVSAPVSPAQLLATVEPPPPAGDKLVGIIVGLPSFHLYYSQLTAVFSHRLRQAGWTVVLATSNNTAAGLHEALNALLIRGVQIFSINPPPYMNMTPVLDDLLNHGALVQTIGRSADYPRCDSIGTDNEGLGYQAARHLLELGHTRIVYQGETLQPTARDRASGYIRAMQERGLPPRIFHKHLPHDPFFAPLFVPYLESNDSMDDLVRQVGEREITGVFCFNDDDAARLAEELHNHSLEVPRDVSLVSVDNMPYYRYHTAPLTTFALPGEEIGRQAAELLLRRIAGENFSPQQIAIPATFVKRGSTAQPCP